MSRTVRSPTGSGEGHTGQSCLYSESLETSPPSVPLPTVIHEQIRTRPLCPYQVCLKSSPSVQRPPAGAFSASSLHLGGG